jgi:ABC-type transport system substrate-binding protein
MAQFRIDTIWDPWLRELDMRRAIVHSINCPAIVDSIYGGATTCRGNHGAPGVLGITEENIKPYEFDPDLSRQLLEQIGYICGLPNSRPDCEAEISITSRTARIEKNEELVESMVSFMKDVGINATASFVETSIRTAMGICGIGLEGAGGTQVGWQGATEATPPTCEGGVGVGQILDGLGFGYETMDYAKFVNRHMLYESGRSTVYVPGKEEEWSLARTLAGEERRKALEEIANWQREHVYIIAMFDLFAVYGVNPKLRGFEEPRFDKHTFAGLWWFEE